MDPFFLTAEDLLAGAEATFDVVVPPEVLATPAGETNGAGTAPAMVRLRPLTIGAFQLILKASAGDAGLVPLLMVKEALLEPRLSLDQIRRLPLGLLEFLVE